MTVSQQFSLRIEPRHFPESYLAKGSVHPETIVYDGTSPGEDGNTAHESPNVPTSISHSMKHHRYPIRRPCYHPSLPLYRRIQARSPYHLYLHDEINGRQDMVNEERRKLTPAGDANGDKRKPDTKPKPGGKTPKPPHVSTIHR